MVSLKETPRQNVGWAERLQMHSVSSFKLCMVILLVLQTGKGLWLV